MFGMLRGCETINLMWISGSDCLQILKLICGSVKSVQNSKIKFNCLQIVLKFRWMISVICKFRWLIHQ